MATDEELVAAVARGDGTALAELVRRWERPPFGFIHRQTGGRDVEDLHQQTWLRIVRAAGRFDPARRFSTWLFQIALKLCRDWRRRRPPEPVGPGDAATSVVRSDAAIHDQVDRVEAAIDDQIGRVEAAIDAGRLLADLPDAQRAAV